MRASHFHWFLRRRAPRGFTVLELLMVLFIAGVVGAGVSRIGRDIFSFNRYFDNSFSVGDKALKLLRPMTEEIRSAMQSSTGSYPILTAQANEFVFYSDTNSDGLVEEIRYLLSGTTLLKEVVVPSGNPLVYDQNTKTTTQFITGVQNQSQGGVSIFNYYDNTHTGGSTGEVTPGSGNTSAIRLVRITLIIDNDPVMLPAAQTVSTLVAIRNLKQDS